MKKRLLLCLSAVSLIFTAFGAKSYAIDGPAVQSYTSSQAQALPMTNSFLGQSCLGIAPKNLSSLPAPTWAKASLTMTEIRPTSFKTVFTSDFLVSQAETALATITKSSPTHSCTGHALTARLVEENGMTYMDYALEFTPTEGDAIIQPWLTRGRVTVNPDYTGDGEQTVAAFGRIFAIHVSLSPGMKSVIQHHKEDRDFLDKGLRAHSSSGLGSSLPDENPSRTLSQDTAD